MFWLFLLLFLFPWKTDLRKHWHDLHQRMFCLCSLLMGGCVQSLSHVLLLVTPWTVACQAPLSMSFCRKEYWSGLPFPSPGDLPDPGIKSTPLVSPALAVRFFTASASGSLTVPYLILKSSSHHEFIFVCGVRVYSTFTDFHVAMQLSKHPLMKRLCFPCFIYSGLPCQRLIDHRCSLSILIPCCFLLPTAK